MTQKLVAYLGYEIRDINGRLIESKKIEANSLVRQWIDLIYVQIGQATVNGTPDTSNTLRNIPINVSNLGATCPANSSNYGIQLGTGAAAVSLTDYSLQSKIAHGSGGGQLLYQACYVDPPTTTGTTRSFTIYRSFQNNSGGTVSGSEIGLVLITGGAYYFLVDRTLMNFSLLNTQTVTFTYTIQVTV